MQPKILSSGLIHTTSLSRCMENYFVLNQVATIYNGLESTPSCTLRFQLHRLDLYCKKKSLQLFYGPELEEQGRIEGSRVGGFDLPPQKKFCLTRKNVTKVTFLSFLFTPPPKKSWIRPCRGL